MATVYISRSSILTIVRIHIVLVHIVSALDHCAIQCKLVEFIVFKKKVMIIHYIFVGSGRDQNLLISLVHGICKIAEDLGFVGGGGGWSETLDISPVSCNSALIAIAMLMVYMFAGKVKPVQSFLFHVCHSCDV